MGRKYFNGGSDRVYCASGRTVNRKAAERIADELLAIGEKWREETEREHPGFFMTEEQRIERGIPDLTDYWRESMIEELMKHPSKFPEDNE